MMHSRRHFIGTATGGLAWAIGVPSVSPPVPGKYVFVFQGDSITDGNRGRSADPNHIMGHGYAFSVASRVGADFPEAGHQFYNRGISGNTVNDLSLRWQTDALDLRPDVLSILIGINDANAAIKGNNPLRDSSGFETTYGQLLLQARDKNPDILLVLGLPFVFPVGERIHQWNDWKEETEMRAAVVKKMAEKFNAVLVDYPRAFDNAMKKANADYWIWDGIHPTVAGHEIMCREWIKQVSARIGFLRHYKYR